jgi:hypothetical protein
VTQTPWIATVEIATAGNTTIHDPGATNRFQLMGLQATFPSGLVSAGTSILDLQDQAVLISELGTVKGTLTGSFTLYVDLSTIGGIFSAADGNKLILNLAGQAFTTEEVSLTAWGFDV